TRIAQVHDYANQRRNCAPSRRPASILWRISCFTPAAELLVGKERQNSSLQTIFAVIVFTFKQEQIRTRSS
ncbi:hypothetical protein, partial [Sinorhizobium medicae]